MLFLVIGRSCRFMGWGEGMRSFCDLDVDFCYGCELER